MRRCARARLVLAAALLALVLAACERLLTDPRPPSDVAIAFQVAETPPGRVATAFSRVRVVGLRFTRPDQTFRDTIVPVLPVDGVIRTAISIPVGDRSEVLGVQARLGYGTTVLFEGGTIVRVDPGQPATAEVPLVPVPAAVVADRAQLTIATGATALVRAATLFASGDTLPLPPTWTSADPLIALVTPLGTVTGVSIGQTLLEARRDTLADTVLVDVGPPASKLISWVNAAGGSWSAGANWSTGVIPTLGDSVRIDLAGTYSILMDGAIPVLGDLRIGAATGAQLVTAVGRAISVSGDVVVTGGATLRLDAASVVAPTVTVDATATLDLEQGSSVDAPVVSRGLILADSGGTVISGGLTTFGTSMIRVGGGTFVSSLAVPAGFTNNGTIELYNGGTISTPGSTLVNAVGASITTLVGPIGGGAQVTGTLDNRGSVSVAIQLFLTTAGASHVNTGTIAISSGAFGLITNGADAFDNRGTIDASGGGMTLTLSGTGAGFTNSGSVTVGSGYGVQVTNGPFVSSSGSISGQGSLWIEDASATLSAPTTLGVNGPLGLLLRRATLSGAGLTTGAGSFLTLDGGTVAAPLAHIGGTLAVAPAGGSVTGALTTASGVLISIEANQPAVTTSLTVANGFTNLGQILLGNSVAGAPARLEVTTGTLVNGPSGSITSLVGAGAPASHYLTAQLDNQGNVGAAAPLLVDATGASHVNSGAIQASGASVSFALVDAFDNTGLLAATGGHVSVNMTGAGAGFTTSGTVDVQSGWGLNVFNGAFSQTGGAIGGTGVLRLDQVSGSTSSALTLGTASGPSNVTLVNASLTSPGVTTAPGTVLRLEGATLNGPLTSQGLTWVRADAQSSITGAVTTTGTSTIRVTADGANTGLSVAAGFTNNGLVELTDAVAGAAAALTLGSGVLALAPTGTLRASAGVGGGARTVNGDVSNTGTIDLTAPLTVNGQLVDPVGASSTYTSDGSGLGVTSADVDGAVLDDMPLTLGAGTLVPLNNVTFQNMDPTVVQLTVAHPGSALGAIVFNNLSFSTTPTGPGRYMSVTDTDGVVPLLVVEVLASTPASGFALSSIFNGATLIW